MIHFLDAAFDGSDGTPLEGLPRVSWRWVATSLICSGKKIQDLAKDMDCPISALLSNLTGQVEYDEAVYRKILGIVDGWSKCTNKGQISACPPPQGWYVNTWIRGTPGRRNKLLQVADVRMLDFYGKKAPVDCYATIFGFTPDFKKFVDATGSVEGYSGPTRAWGVHIDMDGPTAYNDVRELLTDVAVQSMAQVFFSGSKGFHVHLDTADEPAGIDVPERVGAVCRKIAGRFRSFDAGVYDRTRLWRIPNSLNSCGGHKIPLLVSDLIGPSPLSMEDIKRRALRQRSLTEAFVEHCDRVGP